MRKTFRKKSLRSRKTKKQLRRTRRRNRRLRGGTPNLDALRRVIASDLHKAWAKTVTPPQLRCTDGKKPNGEGICSNGVTPIDIASRTYDELPPFWQNANNAAVDIALAAFAKFPDDRPGAGNYIHEGWMHNNSWILTHSSEDDPRRNLFVPFAHLDPEEQEKDLKHYDIIKSYIREGKIGLDEIQSEYRDFKFKKE